MKDAVAVVLLFGIGLSLMGCSDGERARLQQEKQERYTLCIENGGSWSESSWDNSESCKLP